MSPDERSLAPRPGDWSAAQVVAHLALVEEVLVDDWHTAAKKSPSVQPSRKAGLIVGMASIGMKSPFRVPTIPTLDPSEREPNGSGDLGALSERWGLARERLHGTLPSDATRLWIIHPVFGPLSCQQFGPFFVVHLQHHLMHWPAKETLTSSRK